MGCAPRCIAGRTRLHAAQQPGRLHGRALRPPPARFTGNSAVDAVAVRVGSLGQCAPTRRKRQPKEHTQSHLHILPAAHNLPVVHRHRTLNDHRHGPSRERMLRRAALASRVAGPEAAREHARHLLVGRKRRARYLRSKRLASRPTEYPRGGRGIAAPVPAHGISTRRPRRRRDDAARLGPWNIHVAAAASPRRTPD